MKILAFVSALLLALNLVGCATTSYAVGRDFSSDNVKQIVQGKTTPDDIKRMFGAPYSTSTGPGGQQVWTYTYSKGTSHAQSFLVTTSVQTTGNQKTLSVMFKDGVVESYSYSEAPIGGGAAK